MNQTNLEKTLPTDKTLNLFTIIHLFNLGFYERIYKNQADASET